MALLTGSKVPVVHGIAMVRKMITFYPLQESLKSIENLCFSVGTFFAHELN